MDYRTRSEHVSKGLVLLATISVALACADHVLTDPNTPDELTLMAQLVGGSGGEASASFAIPTPETNFQTLGWTSTGIEVAAGVTVPVVVSGFLTLEINPERLLIDQPVSLPSGGLTAGPTGWEEGPHRMQAVHVRIRMPSGVFGDITLLPDDQDAESVSGEVTGPGAIEVSRGPTVGGTAGCFSSPGPGFPCQCPHNSCEWYADDFLVHGSQTLVVGEPEPDEPTDEELRDRLVAAVENICVGAAKSRRGACRSFTNMLANVNKQLDKGHTGSAKSVLEDFILRVDQAALDGAVTEDEYTLLTDDARMLADRLAED